MKNEQKTIPHEKNCVTGFLPGLFLPACTQAQKLDSLWHVWQDQEQPDSSRVQAYYDYIWNGFLYSHPDSAFMLAEALHDYG
jgi:hypothetical protein